MSETGNGRKNWTRVVAAVGLVFLAVALGGNALGGGKFSLMESVIGAYTIQALTTTLYAMNVSTDQLPVYKAIVVIIIVTLQSPVFQKFMTSQKMKRANKAVEGGNN